MALPIEPRPMEGPLPLPPLPQPMMERAPMLDNPGPDGLTRLLAPFAQFPLAQQVALLQSRTPVAAHFLLGLLRGMGQSRVAGYEQDAQTRGELNRRFASDAAERNRENLRASRDAEERRMTRLHGESDRMATEKRAEERKAAEDAAKLAGERLTPSEARELNLPLSATLVPIAELPKDVRDRLPPKRPAAPRAPRIGPALPTVAAVYRDLKNRAQDSRMYTPGIADSLDSLANVVDAFHAQLREAQTPEDVDAIDLPDNLPPDVGSALAKAIRYRKHQLGAKP